MTKVDSRTPWPVYAIVSIVVALIGAYAVIESNKNSQPADIPEIRIVDEREDEPEESSITPSQRIVGSWESKIHEYDMNITILLDLRFNGAYTATWYYPDETSAEEAGSWQYSNDLFVQVFANGTSGKSRIRWITNDKFELTIIDNGVPSDSGKKRYWTRKY